jgi:hypothetical protein
MIFPPNRPAQSSGNDRAKSVLLIWFFFLVFAHNWVYRIHTKWFNISPEKFDEIHYAGMALFKIGILLFNLAPYLALRIFV